MTEEIKAIIEKSLPAQVGTTLKGVLEQAERDAATVKRQAERINDLEKGVLIQEERIKAYQKFDERNAELDKREKALDKKELLLETEKLKYELESEKGKTQFSKDVALGLVRNIEYRKNIFDSETQAGHYDAQGRWVVPNPVCKSFEEKKEAK